MKNREGEILCDMHWNAELNILGIMKPAPIYARIVIYLKTNNKTKNNEGNNNMIDFFMLITNDTRWKSYQLSRWQNG